MSTPSEDLPVIIEPAQPVAPATGGSARGSSATETRTRPLYWSVRRELWEHRSIWMVPLGISAVVLVGLLIASADLPSLIGQMEKFPPAQRKSMLGTPFEVAAATIIMISFVVAVGYSLDALYSERRDRSVLFWKSLPVSDVTTVIAKAVIPLVVLPAIAVAVVTALQLAMLLIGSAMFAIYGLGPAQLWTDIPHLRMWMLQLYGTVAVTLWLAPVYAWLMLASAWAKRAPFFWAVLPPLALMIVEGIAFRTIHIGSLLKSRLFGGYEKAFTVETQRHNMAMQIVQQPDPIGFVTAPGLWIGLVVAAALFAAAVWIRRRREPS